LTALAAADIDTAVGPDETGRYVESPAFVATTRHVPALAALNELPEIEQPVAVPLVTVNVTAPVLDPPLVVKVSGFPAVPVTLVTVSALCAVPTPSA
jgi:hypothetical protein